MGLRFMRGGWHGSQFRKSGPLRLLLLDDVYTTGATVAMCRRALQDLETEGWVSDVRALNLCVVPQHSQQNQIKLDSNKKDENKINEGRRSHHRPDTQAHDPACLAFDYGFVIFHFI